MEKTTLSGIVIKGKQLGRKLGFPTANLVVDPSCTIKQGVWYVKVTISEQKYKGVANLGTRPSVERGEEIFLEVNIFNFCDQIYGKKIEVEMIEHLREEQKFQNLEELQQAIKTDVARAKVIAKID